MLTNRNLECAVLQDVNKDLQCTTSSKRPSVGNKTPILSIFTSTLRDGRAASVFVSIFALKVVGCIVGGIVSFFLLYYAASSPPLHLFYDAASHAGPGSVYLPVRLLPDDSSPAEKGRTRGR
jgi:hypothetical protein